MNECFNTKDHDSHLVLIDGELWLCSGERVTPQTDVVPDEVGQALIEKHVGEVE